MLMPSVVDILVNDINKHLTENHQDFMNLISRRRGNLPLDHPDSLILNLGSWEELCDPLNGYLFGIGGLAAWRPRPARAPSPGMCVDIVAASLGTTQQQLLNDFNEGGVDAIRAYSERVGKICSTYRFTAMIRSQLPVNLVNQLRITMRGAGRRADYYP
jgi:hypothetical protein